MPELKSNKFPTINYETGEGFHFFPEDSGMPFIFDVSDDLTSDKNAMAIISSFLDDIDSLKEKAITCLKTSLDGKNHELHSLVYEFLSEHNAEVYGYEALKGVFGIDNPETLTIEQKIDYFRIRRFGSCIDDELNKQIFIMDLSFNPDYTDQLMVFYFDVDKNIITFGHES